MVLHMTQKQTISETFFPANLLASTDEIKPNTTEATVIGNTKILQDKIFIKQKLSSWATV